MTLQDTANQATVVAKASVESALAATLIGIVPILSFGLLIALSILVVSVPVKVVGRLVR